MANAYLGKIGQREVMIVDQDEGKKAGVVDKKDTLKYGKDTFKIDSPEAKALLKMLDISGLKVGTKIPPLRVYAEAMADARILATQNEPYTPQYTRENLDKAKEAAHNAKITFPKSQADEIMHLAYKNGTASCLDSAKIASKTGDLRTAKDLIDQARNYSNSANPKILFDNKNADTLLQIGAMNGHTRYMDEAKQYASDGNYSNATWSLDLARECANTYGAEFDEDEARKILTHPKPPVGTE